MKTRLEIFEQIIRYASENHIRLNRFWGSFVETARFKLGESIKDIKIPFSLDSESSQTIREALEELFEFIRRRHEVQFKAPTDRSIDDFVGATKLPAKTYSIRFHRLGTVEHSIIRRCLEADPLLDAGIFEAWLANRSSGSRLLATFQGILNKALVEEIKSEHLEKTAYLAHLALIKELNAAKSVIKKSSVKGMTYEQMDLTFGHILFTAYDAVLSGVVDNIRARKVPPAIAHTFLLMQSTCHPLSFTAIKQAITRVRFNPYDITQESVDLLDPVYREISQRDTALNFVRQNMVQQILGNSKIKSALLEDASIAAVRQSILEYLFEHDNPGFHINQMLRDLIQDHTTLSNLLFDAKKVDVVAEEIRKWVRQSTKDEARSILLSQIESLLRLTQKGGLTKRSQAQQELVARVVESYLGYKIDLYLDRFSTEVINLLENRQPLMSVAQLKQDYESGRLYRISADPQPTLMEFNERFEGQLFIDLKDFTKRTHFSKEIIMADFLETEFYKPILDAARKYHSAHDGGGKSIKLINLLGDAVIFSGNIESLVYLAQDIQNIFKDYRQKLKESSPSNLEKELKDRIESTHRHNMTQVQAALGEARKKLQFLRDQITLRIQQNFKAHAEQFPERLAQEISALEGEFLDLDGRIAAESNPQTRYDLGLQKSTVIQKITMLRGLQKEYTSAFRKMTPDQQALLIAKLFYREALTEIGTLEETIETFTKRDASLRYDYEREIKKIEGFGMDAGLFVSYGTAAEQVRIRDEVWGDQEVAIAESINESARGTARNALIKKMLDARLAEQARLRGKPDLVYPYNTFVERTYAFRLSPQQNAEFHSAVKSGSLPQAEQILHYLLQESLKDTRELFRNPESDEDRRTLGVVRDIYNEGEAISEEALNAFLRETMATRRHFRRTYPVRKFNQQILERFLFLTDAFQFVLSISYDRNRENPLIFRYAGDLVFRGFENKGSTGIYELLKFDSPFYQLLLQHHVPDWLQELDSKGGA